ncbi:FtsH-like AAA+ protein [Haematococcus lacustris]|uniref:FtsH-like AAA+ protein n=1 Tax=Haematococcus lacustris TaxID=44745 RepID=A0A6A0A5W2_HAELA|nr:FtsH-like AAA+ protein [Haematococcus lacustris]
MAGSGTLGTAPHSRLRLGCMQVYFCVRQSQAHPRFKSLPPLHTNVWLGIDDDGADQEDPLLDGFDLELGVRS